MTEKMSSEKLTTQSEKHEASIVNSARTRLADSASKVPTPSHDVLPSSTTDGKSGGGIKYWLDTISTTPTELDTLRHSDDSEDDGYVNSYAGESLPPIEPRVDFQPDDGPRRGPQDKAWRRVNMTSQLYISQRAESREEFAAGLANKHHPIDAIKEPLMSPECIVRPVSCEDFEQIAKMMNLEKQALHSPQIVHGRDFHASDIKEMADKCEIGSLPFIVAVLKDPLMNEAKWPQGSSSAYQAYLKYRETQPQDSLFVAGFAVVQEARFGYMQVATLEAGMLRMMVHPDHRKKRVGTALLDAMLCLMDPRRQCLEKLDMLCEMQSKRHRGIDPSELRFKKLYIEVFCEASRGESLEWREEFVDRRGFRPVGYLYRYVKTIKGDGTNQLLDMGLWEFEF